jgi:molybdopterin converting factor small subunit
MPVTVKLPTILRKFAGDEARVTVEGATLEEVLKDLESRYPASRRTSWPKEAVCTASSTST